MSDLVMVTALICGVLAAIGLVFLLIGLLRRRMTRTWVSTTGQVITRTGGVTGMPARYPTFRWQDVTGTEHRHTSMVAASLGPAPGALVPVRYDPQQPHRGMIDSDVQNGQLFCLLGIGLLVASIAAAGAGVWMILQS